MSAAAGDRAFERGDLALIRPLVVDGATVASSGPWLGLVDYLDVAHRVHPVAVVRPLSDLREIRWVNLRRLDLVQRGGQ